MKILTVIVLLLLSLSSYAAESYFCTITEVIEAKFEYGKWLNTNVHDGKGVYQVVIDGEKATVIEKIAERNESYPIETSCKLIGGTVGYRCKKFTKITPYGEKYFINLEPSLNEITIDAQYTMRNMDDYSADFRRKNSKYFNGIRMGFTKSYGRCIKH